VLISALMVAAVPLVMAARREATRKHFTQEQAAYPKPEPETGHARER